MSLVGKTHPVGFLPKALRGLQNLKWNASGALAELIDNSFGPLRGDAKEVWIFHDPKSRQLQVLDNGQGMDAIGRLFEHGNTIGRGIGDIGEYGSGGTMAILWLSETVKICTLRNQKLMQDSVRWSDWFKARSFNELSVSNEWRRAIAASTPGLLWERNHGTLINMILSATRKLSVGNIQRDLARLFSPGIRGGKRIHWITLRNNKVIDEKTLTDPMMKATAMAKSVAFNIVLEYGEEHLPVRGQVYLDEATTAAESKVHIGYAYRVIMSTSACFQSADQKERYAGIGVSGWLDLGEGWQPYLTTQKDGINDTPLFDVLMEHVFQEIRPLLKEAENKTIDLVFEDLALGLQTALNAKGNDIEVLVDMKPGRTPSGDAPPPPGPDPGPMPDLFEPPVIPADNPGEVQKTTPPQFSIVLVPTPDAQMDGRLARSEIEGNGVMICVNKEHPAVQEALKAKPINRMALNLMTISDLTVAIARQQDEGAFVKRLFRPVLAKAINDIADEHDRARTMLRQLMDRVRDKNIQAQAAE